MQTNEAIKLWKELNIDRCEMEFSCGGDSMNDTNFTLYDKEDNEVESEELADYFENQVYKEVEFYEVSDGHYMGEYGKVEITLEEDDDEPYFSYDKQAMAEWEETFSETMYVELSEKESEVLNKVSNINGSIWDNEPNVNYKEDCVITDEESQTLKELLEKIGNLSDEFEVEGKGEESEESRSFESDIELEEGKLLVQVSARFYYTEESND
jgi:hypothetical protein